MLRKLLFGLLFCSQSLAAEPLPDLMFDMAGGWLIGGSVPKNICVAQKAHTSQKGVEVGVLLIWEPVEKVTLSIQHKEIRRSFWKQNVKLSFDELAPVNVEAIYSNKRFFVSINPSSTTPSLAAMMVSSSKVDILLRKIKDSISVDLSISAELRAGLTKCLKWLI
ncbi:MAG: hypothetical protein ACI84R_000311 [Candidatus Azotimanducaceae bacterium]|jgi:hypothetical protein